MILATGSTYVVPIIIAAAPTVAVVVTHYLGRKHVEKVEKTIVSAVNGATALPVPAIEPNGGSS